MQHSIASLFVKLFSSILFLIAVCLSSSAVAAPDQYLTVTVNGTVIYANNVPAPGANILVGISDEVANTYQQLTFVTNGQGQFSVSSTFLCSATSNSIIWDFGFQALLDDGYMQQLGGVGGGSHYCSNGDPPPYQFNPALAGSAQNSPYNAGPTCKSVGKPVNVTNGNMFLQQSDYSLPSGVGENINLTRTYNSMTPTSGSFGFGWKSDFDERVYLNCPPYFACDTSTAMLNTADGHLFLFRRTGNNGYYHFYSPITPGIYGQLVWYATNPSTFTLSFKDGRVYQYTSSTGKILWKRDRNGNQTTYSYDGSNRLIGVIDAFGRTLTITPNPNPNQPGTILQISDSLGVTASYEYETIGAATYFTVLKTVTYSDGSKYKFDYQMINGRPYLITVKDALDNILETHLYDSQGRATTSEAQGGAEKYTLDYTNANLDTNPFTTVTDGLGRVTKYYFDKSKGKNLVTKTEGVCSCGGGGSEVTNYEYNDKWNIVRKTDALLNETTYAYDNEEDLLTQTDVVGTRKWTYNTLGQVLTYKDRVDSSNPDPNVNTAVLTYNASGNLETVKDALNNVTTIQYPASNNKGLPDSIKDARNNITKFKWFAASGLLDEIEDPYTKKTKFTYDARGRTKTVTNALNHVTQYNYFDDTQRKVEMVYPNLDKITYKYDIKRLLESVTDERGKITNYEFDPQYRLKKITDPLGHFKQFSYDLMSNFQYYTDPLGNVTEYKYDDFNRLKEIEYPAATAGATRLKERFEYDQLGRIKKQFDTADRLTEYVYNDQTRTNTVLNADGELTTMKYNQRLQTIEVKDALNQVYTFGYDPLGRVLSQTRAGTTMSFVYDEIGNRTKRTDYIGRVTNYEYDLLNRLKKIKYGDTVTPGTPVPQSTYTYDDISRLTSAANEAGTVSFGYDNRNRLTSTTDVFGQALVYEYERTSTVNQKRLKLNGSLYATYNFDNSERLQNIVNASDNSTIGFTYYDDDLPQTRAFPNGVSTSYLFDNMRRLTRLTDSGPAGTLFDRQYGYNTANQISQMTEPSLTRIFGYDNVNRLTNVTGSASESYVFDDVGNRTSSHRSSTYGYQPFNKIASTQTATYGGDANGNMTSKAEGKEFWRYSWDYENRLTEASTRKQKARYKYDALGRRVQRVLGYGKENTRFTYDGQDVLLDDNPGTLTKYLNGSGIDNKLKQTVGSTTSYFLADHLGSTNGLTNSSGSLTASNSYDSFGNPTNTGFSSRYQFTGREFDSFSGLQYSRARLYDPNLGRFISEDPIGFRGGDVNLYGYVWNDPLNFYDPMGLDGYGNDVADYLDDKIEYARRFYQGDVQEWERNGTVNTIADLASGVADMLRCGNGAGQAYYSSDENIYGRGAFGAMDVARCSAIFSTLAGLPGRSGRVPVVQGEACPTGGFNPFKGKTPPEIDAMMKNKGYIPRGPNPMNGEGNYVNPRSGRGYHVDANHPPPKPPHMGVNRPKHKRREMGPREFPF